jgi:hypothetical protein
MSDICSDAQDFLLPLLCDDRIPNDAMVLVVENDWLIFEEDIEVVDSVASAANIPVTKRPTLEPASGANMVAPEILHDIVQIFNAATRMQRGDVVWLSCVFTDSEERKTTIHHGTTAIGIAVNAAEDLRDAFLEAEVDNLSEMLLKVLHDPTYQIRGCTCYPSIGSSTEQESLNAPNSSAPMREGPSRPTEFRKASCGSGTRGRTSMERWLISIKEGEVEGLLSLKEFPLIQQPWLTFVPSVPLTTTAAKPITISSDSSASEDVVFLNRAEQAKIDRKRRGELAKRIDSQRTITKYEEEVLGGPHIDVNQHIPFAAVRVILHVPARLRPYGEDSRAFQPD